MSVLGICGIDFLCCWATWDTYVASVYIVAVVETLISWVRGQAECLFGGLVLRLGRLSDVRSEVMDQLDHFTLDMDSIDSDILDAQHLVCKFGGAPHRGTRKQHHGTEHGGQNKVKN